MNYSQKKDTIDSLQDQINSFGEWSQELKQRINYKIRLDWNYYSNSMEGNTLTMDETRSVMVGNLTVGGKPIKDVLEMKGHDEVISEILKIGKGEIRLSESRIRMIHRGIMHEEDVVKRKEIGEWKKKPNYIYNYKGERFDFVSPSEVPDRMHDLLNTTNSFIDSVVSGKKVALHPVDIALRFHLEFVLIHPFYDGNGRTARILTNLLLISFGYPPFWIKTEDRGTYNQYIGEIQGYGGSPDLFYSFAADQIIRSQQLVIRALAGNDISDDTDLDKELALLRAELNGDRLLNAKSDLNNVADAFENNIVPLFSLIEDKVEVLKEFFFEVERRIEFEESKSGTRKVLGSSSSSWSELIENWLNRQIRLQGLKLRYVNYNYMLKGFRNRIHAKTVWLKVEVYFNDYNYQIQTNIPSINPLLLPYEKQLSAEELRAIATPIIRDVIQNIKRANDEG